MIKNNKGSRRSLRKSVLKWILIVIFFGILWLVFYMFFLFRRYIQNTISILDSSGYVEGVYVEFETSADYISVYYKSSSSLNYEKVDSELVRINNGIGRVDVLGLTAGLYTLKLVDGDNPNIFIESKELIVTSDDRSGYAHFNYDDGVGAYNDDGSLKSDAVVIYVNDETKNTVTVNIDGKKYRGLGDILENAKYYDIPIDIRIIGAIKTTQWNKISYESAKKSLDLLEEQMRSLGGVTDKKILASTIILNGWNSYTDDLVKGITVLDGLTSYATYENNQYNSYWNMMELKGASNITIEGVGNDAMVFGWGFRVSQCNSIEFKNLTFSNYADDAIEIGGTSNFDMDYSNFWLHNLTFNAGLNNWDLSIEHDKSHGDGSIDFKYAHNLTISYCKFNKTYKTNLIGDFDGALQYNITLHHNYYYHCYVRLPLVRKSNIHIYNNYYDGTIEKGISVRANAFAFIENNYFSGKNPFMLVYRMNDKTDVIGTTIKSIGNEFLSSTTVSDSPVQGFGLMDNGIYVVNILGETTYISHNFDVTRETLSTGSICMPDGITDYSNFDTDSTLFYYDFINKKSDVSRLDDVEDLPIIVPILAGAHVL